MKNRFRILVLATLGLLAAPALAATFTNEVLVLTTATRVDTDLVSRRAIELQNLGPNAIYCAVHESSAAVSTKSRKVDVGAAWAIDLPPGRKVYCLTASNQVTGAATVVTEVD